MLRSDIFLNVPSEFVASLLDDLTTRYLMPNEVLFKKGDVSRELCFLGRGALNMFADSGCKEFLRKITNDSSTVAAATSTHSVMVGEHSFFFGVSQAETVMSFPDGDVSILVLSKEDYHIRMDKYPECHAILVNSLLVELGLNARGDDATAADDAAAAAGGSESAGNNADAAAAKAAKTAEAEASAANSSEASPTDFRSQLKNILMKRSADSVYEMVIAATEGQGVRELLQKGLDVNTRDFDERSVLHLAAAQGNIRVVQLLIKEGADVHARDRYGNNALHEAVTGNHIGVADILFNAGSELSYDNPADYMTAAAGSGDLDKIQTLIRYGVDVNCGDKDGRSALHLVSSEGNLNVVEFLLAHEADANCRDAWEHTPLDGAVEKVREAFCSFIHLFFCFFCFRLSLPLFSSAFC